MPIHIQDSLIVMCKKKARETHRVKNEKIKIQTAKRIGKKNALKEQHLVQTLAKFKDASWLHQKLTSPQLWKTPNKAFDELRKLALRTSRRNL